MDISVVAEQINEYANDMKELALQECLNINYESLGVYNRKQLKDYSFWEYSYGKNQEYSLEGINTLNQFVFQETGSFYKESLPLKAESATLPVNAIFIRCMQFYNSDKLKKLVKYAQP